MPILEHDDNTTTATVHSSSKEALVNVNDDDDDRRNHHNRSNDNDNNNNNSMNDDVTHHDTSPPTPESVADTTTIAAAEAQVVDRRSLRLYSKKHRVYVFREFILRTYSDYLATTHPDSNNDIIILDIAGGKGDLSWVLHNIDQYQSIVVDPRCTINHIDKSVDFLCRFPDECQKRSIPHISTYQPLAALMPRLEQNGYRMESPGHLRIFVDDELVQTLRSIMTKKGTGPTTNSDSFHDDEWDRYWTKATQRTIHHINPSGKNDFSIDDQASSSSHNTITHAATALQYICQAKLIVGYHPDQATDACFELAQLLNIPVCVVPCCVFPSQFPHRRLWEDNDDDDDENDERRGKPVEKYDDLIQYLRQQYPYLQTDALEFPGTTTARRMVLYTLPSSDGNPRLDEPRRDTSDLKAIY